MRTERVNINRVLQRLDEDNISPTNKEYIREHNKNITAKGVGVSRQKKYIDVLRWWAKTINKDFKEATKDDLIRAVGEVQKSKLKPSTREAYKAVVKTFYKWLLGNDEIFPDNVRWIKPKLYETSNRLPEDFVDEEDVEKLIKTANNTRDKAIISALYESGFRAGEFLGIRMKDMRSEPHGLRVKIDGKTGGRVCLLVASVPYITRYLNSHPRKDDPEAELWGMSYENFKRILKDTAKRAGVTRRVNPHSFRHGRSTYLAKYFTDAQLKNQLGWKQSSRMQSKYIHMSGADNDKAILHLYGIAETEDEASRLKPKVCAICGYRNATDATICEQCYRPLNQKMNVSKDMQEMKARMDKLEGLLLEKRLRGKLTSKSK